MNATNHFSILRTIAIAEMPVSIITGAMSHDEVIRARKFGMGQNQTFLHIPEPIPTPSGPPLFPTWTKKALSSKSIGENSTVMDIRCIAIFAAKCLGKVDSRRYICVRHWIRKRHTLSKLFQNQILSKREHFKR